MFGNSDSICIDRLIITALGSGGKNPDGAGGEYWGFVGSG
jgi:hypothetical protein